MDTDQIIALVGIGITGLFSALVWMATSQTAKIAKATLELNKSLISAEEKRASEQQSINRALLISSILEDFRKVENALAALEGGVIFSRLKGAPTSLSITNEQLAKYFSHEEVDLITDAWNCYKNFREKNFRDVYGGNDIEVLVEKAPFVTDQLTKVINSFQQNKQK